ncbi:protease PrsW [Microbacterium bovistercoris]|uniref:Protease PrsW n=1 Tax=Microbacterium bovistercoris TaxID=2293570 RepID=A0A371NUZ4_9MICO|nr:PrsW family intramembrane metalloprotease [Microbacterium bovistercoris]REJ06120.1 protease PrsW [Microbacterium bovistercoris]
MTSGGQPPAYGPPPAQGGGPHAYQPPRPTYPSALAKNPTRLAPQAPVAPAPGPALPALPTPVRKGRTMSIWVFGVLAFALLQLIGYFVNALGTGASVLGLILALVPLSIVLLGVWLIDRWEPEPRSLVVFALAWGAIGAVGIALLVDRGLGLVFGDRPDGLTAVVQAPLVEEIGKGLGVFLIYVFARRAFNGPVDGVVYGALVGAGFAFTENIQYFAISVHEGGGQQLTATFVVRGLMSPFAHAMFTSLTGFAIGIAARRGASAESAFGTGCIGVLGAIALHALWNGSSLFGDFFPLYLTMQVPLFVGFILGIVGLRREEARLTRERLGDYAKAGWFTPEEVTMLATPAGRRTAMRWASSLRGDRRPLMKSFIRDATELAAVRQRAITGHDRFAAADEHALLVRTRATRAALLAY